MSGKTWIATLGLALAWTVVATPVLAVQEADTAQADSAIVADSAEMEPLPPTQEGQDEATRSELRAIFDRVPSMEHIEVAVSAGVVRLIGEVGSRETVDRAVDLANSRDGVVFVDGAQLTALSTEARLEDVGGRLQQQLHAVLQLLPLLAVALAIVLVFGFLAWLIGRRRKTRLFRRVNPFLAGMLQRLLQTAVFLVGLVIALQLLDATALVGAVVGTAGLAGLAFGFAFKDIAENYLAGIILSLRQPFEKNDLIVVGGHEGKVVRLTGRETILMTPDGNHVQIPNATVFREPMLNYSRNPRRRFTVPVDVTADTDLAAALDIGTGVVAAMHGVIADPAPSGLITGSGNGTMALKYFAWVDQRHADFARVKSEAIRLIKEALEAAGVELPSPEYRVTLGGPYPEAVTPAQGQSASRPTRPRPIPQQRDVSVDTALDQQIEEERKDADEEDLLE